MIEIVLNFEVLDFQIDKQFAKDMLDSMQDHASYPFSQMCPIVEKCPECGGSGEVELLIKKVPCSKGCKPPCYSSTSSPSFFSRGKRGGDAHAEAP